MKKEFEAKEGKGKREYQRLKPYLVMEYLMRITDKDNPATSDAIVEHLQDYGINAERRGIYKDIEEINIIQVILEEEKDTGECTVQQALEILEEDPERRLIISGKKGFYVQRNNYTIEDIRLLAECVYATKFISQKQADALTKLIFDSRMVSEKQVEKIRHNALVVGRIKTENNDVYDNIGRINEAMSTENKHIPEKISFNYLRYSISDMTQQVTRKGERYIVSPYQLLINDGNYYLLAYDGSRQKMMTYRVDRMKKVHNIGEKRDGEKEFEKINLATYTQSVFDMFAGQKQRVMMRFVASLLDTIIDRFGKKDATYGRIDEHHYRISVDVEVSPLFFAWVCGFGGSVIIETPDVAEAYLKHLEKIRKTYAKSAKNQ